MCQMNRSNHMDVIYESNTKTFVELSSINYSSKLFFITYFPNFGNLNLGMYTNNQQCPKYITYIKTKKCYFSSKLIMQDNILKTWINNQ